MTFARIAVVLAGLLAASLLCLAVSTAFGQFPISLRAVFADPTSQDANIFWELRVPRALLAVVVGLALGASGCVLQGLLRNPLADPFVLGVSGGAALGATFALAVGFSSLGVVVGSGFGEAVGKVSAPSLFAFIGALGATALVFAAGKVGGRTTPYAALLSGVIFNAFAAAGITCIKTLSAPDRVGEILYWLAGTLSYERLPTLALAGALQLLAVGAMWLNAGRLNLLTLGDEDAASLGVPVERTRMILLLAASLSVAGAVALSGMVGFVGLIVPHVLRLWLGPDQRLLLPASAIGGAGFLALSDLFARIALPLLTGWLYPWTAIVQKELPVGVITALLGGPFFLVLLHRKMAQHVLR